MAHISQDTSEAVAAANATAGANFMVLRMTMAVVPIIGLLIAIFVFVKNYILTEEKMSEINMKLKSN